MSYMLQTPDVITFLVIRNVTPIYIFTRLRSRGYSVFLEACPTNFSLLKLGIEIVLQSSSSSSRSFYILANEKWTKTAHYACIYSEYLLVLQLLLHIAKIDQSEKELPKECSGNVYFSDPFSHFFAYVKQYR